MKQLKFIGRREGISTYQYGPHYIHAENKLKILEMIASKRAGEVFYVSETYSQVTPESASEGDFSECGYSHYGTFYTLKDVLSMERIKSGRDNGDGSFYDGDFHVVSYRDGIEEEGCSHVTASKRNMERLRLILEQKNK